MQKAFLESEYKKKISTGERQRLKKYYNEIYKKGDKVYYQKGGLMNILEQVSNNEVKLDIPKANGGLKRVHKCKVSCKYSNF